MRHIVKCWSKLAGDGGVRSDRIGASCCINERCNHFCFVKIGVRNRHISTPTAEKVSGIYASLNFVIYHTTLISPGIGFRLLVIPI